MTPGLVSTIIPVFNRPVQLSEAVQSVLDQDYRPIEIIIVDDGSTDETLATAQALERSQADIVRVMSKTNGGPGLAREHGRQQAHGEFIQYLDSDDVLLPGKFSVQVAALRHALLRAVGRKNGLLPAQISGRSKFGAPLAASWMDDDPAFRSFARDLMLRAGSVTREMGLHGAMTKYFDQGRRGDAFPLPLSIFRNLAWRLLLLELWSQHYVAPVSGSRS